MDDQSSRQREEGQPTSAVDLDAWLDDKENERDALIMRLRKLERILVEHGRLKSETLPRPVRS